MFLSINELGVDLRNKLHTRFFKTITGLTALIIVSCTNIVRVSEKDDNKTSYPILRMIAFSRTYYEENLYWPSDHNALLDYSIQQDSTLTVNQRSLKNYSINDEGNLLLSIKIFGDDWEIEIIKPSRQNAVYDLIALGTIIVSGEQIIVELRGSISEPNITINQDIGKHQPLEIEQIKRSVFSW